MHEILAIPSRVIDRYDLISKTNLIFRDIADCVGDNLVYRSMGEVEMHCRHLFNNHALGDVHVDITDVKAPYIPVSGAGGCVSLNISTVDPSINSMDYQLQLTKYKSMRIDGFFFAQFSMLIASVKIMCDLSKSKFSYRIADNLTLCSLPAIVLECELK